MSVVNYEGFLQVNRILNVLSTPIGSRYGHSAYSTNVEDYLPASETVG